MRRYYSPITKLYALLLSSLPSRNLPYPPGSDCTPHTATELLGRIKKNVGNLAFFYHTFFFSSFFFPRDEAGPRGPCTLHTECDNLLFPDTLCQSLSSGTVYAIHDSSPPSLLSFSLVSSSSSPFFIAPIYSIYEYVYYVAPRSPDARQKFGPCVWPRAVTMDKRRSRSRFLSSRFNWTERPVRPVCYVTLVV